MAEPLNATFFAFRRRERGGVLTGATLAFLLLMVALYAGFVALFWVQLQPVMAWYFDVVQAAAAGDVANPAAMAPPAALGTLILGGLAFVFLFCLLLAAYEAACLRWMIHGETSGFMGLSLGADTWRVYAGYWLWLLLYIAYSIAMMFVLGTLVFGFAASGAGASDTGAVAGAAVTAMLVFYLGHYGLLLYFAIRLAPAAATSVARRKFAFLDSWKVTQGRFWALFGAFLLIVLISLVFNLVYFGVTFGVALGSSMPDWSAAMNSEAEFMRVYMQTFQNYAQSFFSPATMALMIGLQLIAAAISVLFYLAFFGINARAAQAALAEGKIAPAA